MAASRTRGSTARCESEVMGFIDMPLEYLDEHEPCGLGGDGDELQHDAERVEPRLTVGGNGDARGDAELSMLSMEALRKESVRKAGERCSERAGGGAEWRRQASVRPAERSGGERAARGLLATTDGARQEREERREVAGDRGGSRGIPRRWRRWRLWRKAVGKAEEVQPAAAAPVEEEEEDEDSDRHVTGVCTQHERGAGGGGGGPEPRRRKR
uniref:Uncharacterized protein n=1 Tax=Oryza barthii TaxID=65489 RepID=A0A0D3GJG7_9ORYZ